MSSSYSPAVQIFAFGEIAIAVGGAPVAAGPPKQRTVLGLLLSRADAGVSAGELIDALWGDRTPSSAPSNLRTYVHRLRRILGEDLITGNGRPGYRLHTDRLWTDTGQFLTHCADAERALERADQQAARSALAAAVLLRRGPAFGDLRHVPIIEDEAGRLEERWLRAVEQRAELDLGAGQAPELVAELTQLVGRHPYREKLVALLMLALYRAQRQSQALEVFRRTAAALDQELGVVPGPELADLHQAILRQDPALDRAPGAAEPPNTAGPPVLTGPAELPPGSRHFIGRTRERAALSAALAEARDSGALPVIAVVGPAGVGKTSLVVEWAQTVAAQFPDGQIFADLRGFSAEPATPPAGALRRLLWSLGVDANRVPGTVDEAGALLRSLLSGKRLLIVLDNAASAAQVAPLLPGGAGNAVVVTSRNRLAGLVARAGAQQLRLAALSEDEALDLIERVVGRVRTSAEPGPARELARRCGRLPLALCIAAANVAEEPARTIAGYLAEHGEGAWVSALRAGGDPDRAVVAAFDLSLRGFTARQQRLLVLLGLIPGPTFTLAAATVLAGGDGRGTEADLARLINAHFVQRMPDGRFAFHDLIREYARDRSDMTTPDDRSAAVSRLLRYYLDLTDAADRVRQPGALRLPAGTPAAAAGLDEQSARDWFTQETANLVAACLQAGSSPSAELRTVATRLADALGGHLWTRRDLDTWAAVAGCAAGAARADGDLAAQAAAEIALAKIANCRSAYPAAMTHLGNALRLARRSGWRPAEAETLCSMAALHDEFGDATTALRCWQAALAISRQTGTRLQQGRTLLQIGLHHGEQGRLGTALQTLRNALTLVDAENSRIGRAIILNNLADVYLLQRDFDRAAAQADGVLRICDDLGHISGTVFARLVLAGANRGRHRPAAALDDALAALAIAGSFDAHTLSNAHHEVALSYDALGDPVRGVEHHREAYRLTSGIQSRFLDLRHGIALAIAAHRLSRAGLGAAASPDRPERPDGPDLAAALRRARDSGYRSLEGAALAALAEVSRDAGDDESARGYAQQSLAVQVEAGWRTDPALLIGILHPVLDAAKA